MRLRRQEDLGKWHVPSEGSTRVRAWVGAWVGKGPKGHETAHSESRLSAGESRTTAMRPGCSLCLRPTPPSSPTLRPSRANFRIHATSQIGALSSLFAVPLPWKSLLCDEFHSLKTRFQGHLLGKAFPDSRTSPTLSLLDKNHCSSTIRLLSFPYAQVLALA